MQATANAPQMGDAREPLLTKKQISVHYDRSTKWIENWTKKGLPSHWLGGRRAYRLSETDDFFFGETS
jgi:hypothetical protein